MIDSGSATCHVCPLNFATDYPLLGLTDEFANLRLTSANGSNIRVYGLRPLTYQLRQDGRHIGATFVVVDVITPTLSVSRLIKQGISVAFNSDTPPCLIHPDASDPYVLRSADDLFVLPARLLPRSDTS